MSTVEVIRHPGHAMHLASRHLVDKLKLPSFPKHKGVKQMGSNFDPIVLEPRCVARLMGDNPTAETRRTTEAKIKGMGVKNAHQIVEAAARISSN